MGIRERLRAIWADVDFEAVASLMEDIEDESYSLGYDSGYESGREAGYDMGYDSGYESGRDSE